MEHGIELACERRIEIVAGAFGLRQVEHADGPFEHDFGQRLAGLRAQRQEEPIQSGGMEQGLPAVGQGRHHALSLGIAVPFRGGENVPRIGGKADQQRAGPRLLAHQLPQTPFAAVPEFGGAGIAHMGVVRPHHDAPAAATALPVGGQRVEASCHVRVAQVPCVDAAPEHLAVVGLGMDHHFGVLLGEVVRIQRAESVAREVGGFVAAQLEQLPDGAVAGGLAQSGGGLVAVGGRVAHMVERGIVTARRLRLRRIGAFQIADHRIGGAIEAIEIQPVDTGPLPGRQPGVVRAQPFHERQELAVPPHPGRKPLEIGERLRAVIRAFVLHVAIDAPGIGPVTLDGEGVESVVGDQRLRDLRTHPVELRRAVRGFAQQDELPAGGHVEQRRIVRGVVQQAVGGFPHGKERCKRRRHVSLPAAARTLPASSMPEIPA